MRIFEQSVLATLLIILLAKAATAIKCWECRSDNDPKCGNPFDNSTVPMIDCSKKSYAHINVTATMCRKTRQKVHGEWRYIRSCAFLGEPGIENDERFCLMRTGSYNIFMEYCTCNSKDGCNGAGLLRSSAFRVGAVAALVSAIAWMLRP